MSVKRKNIRENVDNRKKMAVEDDDLSELENLPSELKIEIFNYLTGNELKNLCLVSKNIKDEVGNSRKLMSNLVLDINKMKEGNPTRKYSNIKVDRLNIENLRRVLRRDFGSSVTLKWENFKFFMDGLKNDEQSLLNFDDLKMDDFQLYSAGRKVWKLKACSISNMDAIEEFLSKVQSLETLVDLSLTCRLQDAARLSSAFDKMISLNLTSLKRLRVQSPHLDHMTLYPFVRQIRETLQISQFILNFKSTLQSVVLIGTFGIVSYKTLLNEMPNLKELILAPRKRDLGYNQDIYEHEFDEVISFQPNYIVETFYHKLQDPKESDIYSELFSNLKNVKVLYINQNELSSNDWKSIMENMLQLHTVHIMQPVSKTNILKENILPSVKTLCFLKACSNKSQWKAFAQSFPNIETLSIGAYNPYKVGDKHLENISRSWNKSLKLIEFGQGFHATIDSFIDLLQDFPELKTVVVSEDAFTWNISTVMWNHNALNEFMKNGLQLFSLDMTKNVEMSYRIPTFEFIVQSPSMSNGVEIKI